MKNQNTYHNQTAKFIATVTQNMPKMSSDVMQNWIENPRELSNNLTKALCPSDDTVEYPEFMRLKIGTHDSADALRKSLDDKGNSIDNWGNSILDKITLAESETDILLHSATVEELTGKDTATNREIFEAICAKGYDLCSAEVGPQLRLQYGDQPRGEYLLVAMEPVTSSSGRFGIFFVNHVSYGRRLDGIDGRPDGRWDGDDRFVFVSRK